MHFSLLFLPFMLLLLHRLSHDAHLLAINDVVFFFFLLSIFVRLDLLHEFTLNHIALLIMLLTKDFYPFGTVIWAKVIERVLLLSCLHEWYPCGITVIQVFLFLIADLIHLDLLIELTFVAHNILSAKALLHLVFFLDLTKQIGEVISLLHFNFPHAVNLVSYSDLSILNDLFLLIIF
jgi:hypothetical protein